MRPLKVLLKGLGWVTPRRVATCAAGSHHEHGVVFSASLCVSASLESVLDQVVYKQPVEE